MATYLIVCTLLAALTTTKGDATAKSESSSDSKSESYNPVVEIHPPLINLPHHGIYPPGFSAPILPQHLDIFHQSQYGHVGDIASDKKVAKTDFKLVQKHTERKGKQLNQVKVKKVYTDGLGGIKTKTEKLYADDIGAHAIGHGHDVHNNGAFFGPVHGHHLPYQFLGGPAPHYANQYPLPGLPYPYHFSGFGYPGQFGHILGPHSHGHHGYGLPAYGQSLTHQVIAHPGAHSGHAETHTLVGHAGKSGLHQVSGHGVAHVHPGPGPVAPALGYGIGHYPVHPPHGSLHIPNHFAHFAGPLHHGITQGVGPLGVHAGHHLNGLAPAIAHGPTPGPALKL